LADGYEFLLSTRRRFDAIVLDAFHGDIIPGHLKARAFFKATRAHLTRNGVLLANVHMADDGDPAADRMAAQMATAFRQVRVLDRKGRRHRNVILMAGAVRGLKRPVLHEKPAADLRYITNAFRDMRFRRRKRMADSE
jgi:hypothetical protein